MNAAKRPPVGKWTSLVSDRFNAVSTKLLVAAALCVALAVAAFVGWKKWGPEIAGGSQYKLTADEIEVTRLPPWIHADVKSEVIRDGSLAELSILDPNVTVQVAQAFALHPWIAEVKRVRKVPPARVVVELAYRRPIAMVQATSGGFWPVDTTGVLLPPEEFSPQQTRNYLRVLDIALAPAGPVGTPYGDPAVVDAAAIAAVIADKRWEIGVDQIQQIPSRAADPAKKTAGLYQLTSSTGPGVILWGRAPGREASGEATASEKLARLTQFVAENGPIHRSHQPLEVDVRDGQGMRISEAQSGERGTLEARNAEGGTRN